MINPHWIDKTHQAQFKIQQKVELISFHYQQQIEVS
jgi:hypothetical protein